MDILVNPSASSALVPLLVLFVGFLCLGSLRFTSSSGGGSSVMAFLIILAFSLAGGFLLSQFLFRGHRADDSHEMGTDATPISQEWVLESIDTQERLSLQSLRGKVVFVNLWATWCPPCVAEMPSIVKLHERFKDADDVAFVLVSRDDGPAEVKSFLAKTGYQLPVYFTTDPAPSQFATNGIPATFILDKELSVQLRHIGARDWDGKDVVAFLEKLRGAKSESKTAAITSLETR